MRASRSLVLVSLALVVASSGCMRRPGPRPVAIAAPVAAEPATAEPAAMPPPVIPAPPEAIAEPVAVALVVVTPAVVVPVVAMAQADPFGVMAEGEPSYRLDSGDKLRVVVFGQEGLSNSYAVDPT